MKKFVFIQYGFEMPTPEIMEEWNKWFASIADRIVGESLGFSGGREIAHEVSKELSFQAGDATGLTVIEAKDMDEAEKIARECPFITSIHVYEVREM